MADIIRITVNLFDGEFVQGAINTAGDAVASNERIRSFISVEPDTTYTFSSSKYLRLIYGYNDSSKVGIIYDRGYGLVTSATFTTQSTCNRIGIVIAASSTASGAITPSDISDVMLNLGSTALPYEPYRPHSLSIYTNSGWQNATVKEWDGSAWS